MDTLYIVDINAHPTNTNIDYDTGRKGAYKTGVGVAHCSMSATME